MSSKEIFTNLQKIVANPNEQKNNYLKEGKKIVLVAPVYTPEELIDSFEMVPMGAWGGDLTLNESKRYFPAFICSIVQSMVELGMKGTYEGVSAIIIPSLCDSLKVLGENWKYAVPSIKFIPMTYPQNRKPQYALDYTKAGYQRIIQELETISGKKFSNENLLNSLKTYNTHNDLMRKVTEEIALHPEVSAAQRSAVFKSATFMTKKEHNEILVNLLAELKKEEPTGEKIKIVTTGILADSPSLLEIIDNNNLQIVWDDVAAESRQYKTDSVIDGDPLDCLAKKFANRDNCSVLYDPEKQRIPMIVDQAIKNHAKGVLMVLTKFCDPEEFDYPLLKKACDKANLPIIEVEVDRQMENYEQAGTIIETFKEMIGQ